MQINVPYLHTFVQQNTYLKLSVVQHIIPVTQNLMSNLININILDFLHIRPGFLPFSPVLENLILHLSGVRWLLCFEWRHSELMKFADKWCHWTINEWMCKFICYYENIVHSLLPTLKPFLLIFFFQKWYGRKRNYH